MKLAKLTAALVAAGLALPVIAAPDTATLQKLVERMEKLEARNAELEKQVKSLQGESEEIAKGLDSPRLSQYEPELTVRLKAVEKDALEMKKSASLADKFDGIKVGAALTTVAQHASGLPQGTTDAGGQLNYRADVTVELPLQAIGDIEHKVFAHVRMGQGQGLNAPFQPVSATSPAPPMPLPSAPAVPTRTTRSPSSARPGIRRRFRCPLAASSRTRGKPWN
jgi:high affinity Mn2+ porin